MPKITKVLLLLLFKVLLKKEAGSLVLSDIKRYYKATIINTEFTKR